MALPSSQVKGYERITLGQLPAARLVQSGEVDCCISTQAGARVLGLDFVPLAEKPYHLVLRRTHLELPAVQLLIETLGRASFRREVEAALATICTLPAIVSSEPPAASAARFRRYLVTARSVKRSLAGA